MADTPYRFPALCPKCDQVRGAPDMQNTHVKRDEITVGVRCEQCGHQWTFAISKRSQAKALKKRTGKTAEK